MWGMSWANLTMLMATIPTYESEKEEKKEPVEEVQVNSMEELAKHLKL